MGNHDHANLPPDPTIPRLGTFGGLSYTEAYADAAVLRATHCLVSNNDVQLQNPLMLLPTPQQPIPQPVQAMELCDAVPSVGSPLWVVGFPKLGGLSPTHIRGDTGT